MEARTLTPPGTERRVLGRRGAPLATRAGGILAGYAHRHRPLPRLGYSLMALSSCGLQTAAATQPWQEPSAAQCRRRRHLQPPSPQQRAAAREVEQLVEDSAARFSDAAVQVFVAAGRAATARSRAVVE